MAAEPSDAVPCGEGAAGPYGAALQRWGASQPRGTWVPSLSAALARALPAAEAALAARLAEGGGPAAAAEALEGLARLGAAAPPRWEDRPAEACLAGLVVAAAADEQLQDRACFAAGAPPPLSVRAVASVLLCGAVPGHGGAPLAPLLRLLDEAGAARHLRPPPWRFNALPRAPAPLELRMLAPAAEAARAAAPLGEWASVEDTPAVLEVWDDAPGHPRLAGARPVEALAAALERGADPERCRQAAVLRAARPLTYLKPSGDEQYRRHDVFVVCAPFDDRPLERVVVRTLGEDGCVDWPLCAGLPPPPPFEDACVVVDPLRLRAPLVPGSCAALAAGEARAACGRAGVAPAEGFPAGHLAAVVERDGEEPRALWLPAGHFAPVEMLRHAALFDELHDALRRGVEAELRVTGLPEEARLAVADCVVPPCRLEPVLDGRSYTLRGEETAHWASEGVPECDVSSAEVAAAFGRAGANPRHEISSVF